MQYQFVVGHGREEALRRIVRRVAERRCPSFLAVLKRFGEGDPGWLSFPMPGWTLALDILANLPGLGSFLDELDEEVAGRADACTWRRTRGCGRNCWPTCIHD